MKNKSFLFVLCLAFLASMNILMLSSFVRAQQQAPTVKTSAAKNITATSAEGGYTINSSGVTISKHGLCIGKGPGPTIKNTIYAADKGPGPGFNVQITGLTPGMKLYARAFITTASGTIYGNEVSFTTLAAKK